MTVLMTCMTIGMTACARFISALTMFWMTGSRVDTRFAMMGASVAISWLTTCAICVMTGTSCDTRLLMTGMTVAAICPTVVMTCPITGRNALIADWMPGRRPPIAPPSTAATLSSTLTSWGPIVEAICWICPPNCSNRRRAAPSGLIRLTIVDAMPIKAAQRAA